MQSFCISAALKQIASVPMNFVFGLVRRWIDQFMVPYWMKQLTVAKKTNTLAAIIETSGTRAVGVFARSAPLGSTIFWAVSGAGKSYAVSRCDAGSFMVVDWHGMKGTDAGTWFERLVHWDGGIGEFFRDGFATVVFDHFDNALAINRASAMQLFLNVTMDSVRNGTFNVLVCVSDASNALELLRTSTVHVHLLGPSYCGRCAADDLKQMNATPLAMELAVLSGAIGTVDEAMSVQKRHDDWLSLRAAKANKLWKKGEELLWSYRDCDV